MEVGAFEAVAGAGDGFEFGGDTGGDEAFDEPERLFVGNGGVGGAVDRKDRSGVGRDPVERAAAHVGEAVVGKIGTEPEWEDFGGVD